MKESLIDLMLPAPINGGFRMEGYWVWCGSVIKGEDNRYHMFASRWPKSFPMHPGWLIASEIVRAVSDTPVGPYKFEEVVTPARGAEYWDGRTTHNPHIIKIEDNFVLYYMGTTHPFNDPDSPEKLSLESPCVISARANKRIGIAVSKSVFGPWKRYDTPVLLPRPDKFDNYFTSNPAPAADGNGHVTMVYKTRTYMKAPYSGSMYSGMSFGAAAAESFAGPYRRLLDKPMLSNPEYELEDPFIWIDKDGYNMIAKDMNGNICGEPKGGAMAVSADGISWDFKIGVKAYSRRVLWDDGTVREMGNMERPFILFEGGKPVCMFFAVSNGTNNMGFRNCTETWNAAVPLKIK